MVDIDRLHKVHFEYPLIYQRVTGYTTYCLHIVAGLLSVADENDDKTVTLVIQHEGSLDTVINELVVVLACCYDFTDISYNEQVMWFGDRKSKVNVITWAQFVRRRFGILGSRRHDDIVFDISYRKVDGLVERIVGFGDRVKQPEYFPTIRVI